MDDNMKKIAKISGIAAALSATVSILSYVAIRSLINVAMDRKIPKSMENVCRLISGAPKDEDFKKMQKESGAGLMSREYEIVGVTARDGVTLVGHFAPAKDAKRIIIAMHGWRSAWYNDFGMFEDFLEGNDCSVLYVEQRGQNNSGGDYMGFGLIERYDCLKWTEWVTERCGDELPIYLYGLSMGAATVLMAAGLDLPANVHGIMADSGFTSPNAIWKHIANHNLHLAYGINSAMANRICKKKIKCKADEYSTIDALKNSKVPVLLIHGTDDHFVPVRMTYENYKACTSPKRMLIVPAADHCMSYFVDKEGYEAAVIGFWRQFDNHAGHGEENDIKSEQLESIGISDTDGGVFSK